MEYIDHLQIASTTEGLTKHYEKYSDDNGTESGWYVGITGQGTLFSLYELERIKDHSEDDFPNLDTDSIYFIKVNSVEIALEVEKEMEKLGFDTGELHNPPKEGDIIRVYMFKKSKS